MQKQKITDDRSIEKTDYVGNFVYDENAVLKFILTDYGRINVNNSDYTRQYNISDHLGNTRITFNENGSIIQEDSYYPFGMTMQGLSYLNIDPEKKNNYLYNGKLLDEDFGLNWYSYGFRMYDPQLARFPSLDPKADEFAFISPYNYAENSPVSNIDLWGLQVPPVKPPVENLRMVRTQRNIQRMRNNQNRSRRNLACLSDNTARSNYDWARSQRIKTTEEYNQFMAHLIKNPYLLEIDGVQVNNPNGMKLLPAYQVVENLKEFTKVEYMDDFGLDNELSRVVETDFQNMNKEVFLRLFEAQKIYENNLEFKVRGMMSDKEWNKLSPLEKTYRQFHAKYGEDGLGSSPLEIFYSELNNFIEKRPDLFEFEDVKREDLNYFNQK